MINQRVSATIYKLRFPLICLIVMVHSFFRADDSIQGAIYFNYLQAFFSQVISRLAVPMYFVISGYLFFAISHWGVRDYYRKLAKRVHSLLIPFMFWNLVVIFLFILVQEIPFFNEFRTGNVGRILEFSPLHFLERIFVYPMANQFWFIRDLMLMVIVSPLIYWITKKSGYLLLIISFILMVFFQSAFFSGFKWDSLFFFSLGTFLSINIDRTVHFKIRRKYLFVLSTLYLMISLYEAFYFVDTLSYIAIIHYVNILIGLVILWNVFLKIESKKAVSKLNYLSHFAFIVYAIHVPLNIFVYRFLKLMLSLNFWSLMIIYLATIILCIGTGIVVGMVLGKFCPRFYSVITGNRK